MLYGVALAVGVVVHRINAPFVTRAVMACVLDPVEERITEHHIWMRHIYLRPEHLFAVCINSVTHFAEELEVFLYAAIAVRTLNTGLVNGASTLGNFFLSLVIDIGESPFDEILGPLIKLVEIIGSVALLFPLETEPLDVLLDGVHILDILLDRIGVIVAQVGLASVFLCETEVYAQALGVSEMQVAVRLRREAGEYAFVLAALKVLLDYFLEEIQFFYFFFHLFNVLVFNDFGLISQLAYRSGQLCRIGLCRVKFHRDGIFLHIDIQVLNALFECYVVLNLVCAGLAVHACTVNDLLCSLLPCCLTNGG